MLKMESKINLRSCIKEKILLKELRIIEVEYSWIPCLCSHCKVFGHTDSFSKSKSKMVIDDNFVNNNENEFKVMQNRKSGREGFNMNKGTNMQNGQHDKMWGKDIGNTNNERGNIKEKDNVKINQEGSTSKENRNGDGVLGSNRFTLVNSLIDEEELVPNIDQRKIVDELLNRKNDVNNEEMNGWNKEMKRYFRDRKELFDAAKKLRKIRIIGIRSSFRIEAYVAIDKQKEVKKLIQEEGLQVCVVLETHVKYKNIKKTCDNVFGNWECTSNGEDNNKGFRIMVGWNASMIQA
ncbi:hypothetical protein Tco_0990908 [Tanacetum coccineum]|uniref:Uncharacterized protein n=1 Tax=Tanacetum coccineum TaxID=301880 RepID=A0ABQ5EYF6_9ASTR